MKHMDQAHVRSRWHMLCLEKNDDTMKTKDSRGEVRNRREAQEARTMSAYAYYWAKMP